MADRFGIPEDSTEASENLTDDVDYRFDAERLLEHLSEPDGPREADEPERTRVWCTIAEEMGEVRSFRSYPAARDVLGTRPGEQIHHIVEQSQALPHRSGFGLEQINSTDNLVRLPRPVHEAITATYNRKVAGLDIKLRDTMDNLPWEEQYAMGCEIIDGAFERVKDKTDER